MKNSNHFHCLTCLLAVALVAMTSCAGNTTPPEQQKAALSQRLFASPEEAAASLIQAAKAGDKAAMREIFGPEFRDLVTGDEVQDRAHFAAFSRAAATACLPVPEGDDKVILDIGANHWPFAIPLVKRDGKWFFDTDAGREEIINRHIGRDEFYAIGVCGSYVAAQKKYFSGDHDGSRVAKYALKFMSTPGKEDGLYWKSTGAPSPLGALVAEAHAEGYGLNPKSGGAHPFHGYLFRILTRQGPAAPGGELNYMVNGNLTAGFALVAYPERWGKSGIMTFIVNQDGKVYQRTFGETTAGTVAAMTQYNPDSTWTLVTDPGFSEP